MTDFKKGDVVVLKSGSPRMTIEYVGKNGADEDKVWATWFEGAKKHESTFDPEALERV